MLRVRANRRTAINHEQQPALITIILHRRAMKSLAAIRRRCVGNNAVLVIAK